MLMDSVVSPSLFRAAFTSMRCMAASSYSVCTTSSLAALPATLNGAPRPVVFVSMVPALAKLKFHTMSPQVLSPAVGLSDTVCVYNRSPDAETGSVMGTMAVRSAKTNVADRVFFRQRVMM